MDRTIGYAVVRSLLPPGPVRVIDFDCRDGRGAMYLGEVRYCGLERSRVTRPLPGLDVRSGFDWIAREDLPGGFDVAVCLKTPRSVRVSDVAWKLAQSVKKEGNAIIGLKTVGERERIKPYFREVTVLAAAGGVLLANCKGATHG